MFVKLALSQSVVGVGTCHLCLSKRLSRLWSGVERLGGYGRLNLGLLVGIWARQAGAMSTVYRTPTVIDSAMVERDQKKAVSKAPPV